MIPSGDAGIQLFVRNKHPAGRETSPDKILLFVHGATYPARPAFDLPIEGVIDDGSGSRRAATMSIASISGVTVARHGAEMTSAAANKTDRVDQGRGATISIAVDYILKKRKGSKVNVMAGRGVPRSPDRTPASTMTGQPSRALRAEWIRNEPPRLRPPMRRRLAPIDWSPRIGQGDG